MATSGIPEWARREYCHRQTDRDAGAAARDVRPTNYLAAAAVHMRALNAEAHAGGRLAAAAAAKTSTWKAAKVEPAVRAQWWAHRFLSQVKSRLCARSTARGECAHCGATFRSRSQLFEHLRAQGHCVFSVDAACRKLVEAVCDNDADAVGQLLAGGVEVNHRLESGHGLLELTGVAHFGGKNRAAARRILDALVAAGCTAAVQTKRTGARGSAASNIYSEGWLRQWGLSAGPDELATGPLAAAKAGSNLWLVLRLLGEPNGPRRECAHCREADVFCDSDRWTTFACGCYVCVGSAAGWLRAQVEGGATGADVTCVACGDRLAWSEALSVADAATAERLERQTLELAVSQMDDFCWCPKCPSGGAVKPMTPKCNTTAVQCLDCGAKFCRHCKMLAKYHRMDGWEAHADGHMQQGRWLSCADATALGKAKAEAATEAFLAEKTRDCPKCGCKLMHGGGCSHMECRQCHHEFCWLCLKPYSGRYTFDVTPGSTCPCGR